MTGESCTWLLSWPCTRPWRPSRQAVEIAADAGLAGVHAMRLDFERGVVGEQVGDLIPLGLVVVEAIHLLQVAQRVVVVRARGLRVDGGDAVGDALVAGGEVDRSRRRWALPESQRAEPRRRRCGGRGRAPVPARQHWRAAGRLQDARGSSWGAPGGRVIPGHGLPRDRIQEVERRQVELRERLVLSPRAVGRVAAAPAGPAAGNDLRCHPWS